MTHVSNSAKTASPLKSLRHAIGARIHGFRRDGSDTAIAKRMASTTFILRVVNAGIGLVSQVILARWMGEHEYGVYAYVWVWVLLLGGLAGLGLPAAAQRFIPEYTERGDFDRLRGFLRNGGLLSVAVASLFALAGAAVLKLSGTMLEEFYHLPLLIALACVPVFVMVEFQEGVARSYSWADLAFGPSYLIRPLIILGGLGVIFAMGYLLSAIAVMIVSFTAMIVTGIGQLVILHRRLRKMVPEGGRRSEIRNWLGVAWPLLLVDGFYLVLTYTDVLVLQRFHPPSDVANYYAATKVMAIMSFIAFAVATSTAHRFAQYSVSGDKEKLSAFMQDSVKWTFWPSVAVAAGLLLLGKPLLWLFGPEFVDSYYSAAADRRRAFGAGRGGSGRPVVVHGRRAEPDGRDPRLHPGPQYRAECAADPGARAGGRGRRDLAGAGDPVRDAGRRRAEAARHTYFRPSRFRTGRGVGIRLSFPWPRCSGQSCPHSPRRCAGSPPPLPRSVAGRPSPARRE